MKNIYDNLIKNIIYIKESMGLTQQQLGNAIGVKRSSIGAWLEGRTLPTTANLAKISVFYKVAIDDLVRADLPNLPKRTQRRNYTLVRRLLVTR